MTRRTPFRQAVLVLLPLLVLLVPQGTVERTWLLEFGFIVFLAFTAFMIVLESATAARPLRIASGQLQPLLLVVLVYLLVMNPIWSYARGNHAGSIVMTSIPFVLLGTSYLCALGELSESQTKAMLRSVAAAGAVVALAVIGNFFFGDLSWSAGRSTAIEGRRTLSLPILPMGAAMQVTLAVAERRVVWRRIWALLALVSVVAILMSVTRAILLAFVIGTVVSLALLSWRMEPRRRFRMVGSLLVMAIGTAAVAPYFLGSWLDRFDVGSVGDVGTVLGRVDEYAAFLRGFTDSPLLGQGLGHVFKHPSAFDYTLSHEGITVCHSHFFFFLGTTGLVGVALYYSKLARTFFSLARGAGSARTAPEWRGFLAASAGALVAGGLYTLTSTTFTTLSYNLTLGVLFYAAHLHVAASLATVDSPLAAAEAVE